MVVLIPRGDISFQKHITFKNNSQIMDKHVDHVNHNVTECIPTKDCREPYSDRTQRHIPNTQTFHTSYFLRFTHHIV